MKRTLIVMLLLTVIFLTACTQDTKKVELNPKEPVALSLWTYYNGKQKEIMDSMVEDFNASKGIEMGIIVEHKSQASVPELNKKLLASASGKAGAEDFPDIFITYRNVGVQIEKNIELADFSTYFSEEELSRFVDKFLEDGKYIASKPEAIKMFPLVKSTELITLNDTDFKPAMKEAGLDYSDFETFEGITAAAEKYYRYTDEQTPFKNDGKALFSIDSLENYFINGLHQMGEEILIEKNGKVELNLSKENAKKLWDNYYVPFMKGHFKKLGKFTSEDLKTGEILATLSSVTSAPYFPDKIRMNLNEEKPIEILTLPAPYFSDSDVKSVFLQGGGLFMSKSSDLKQLAASEFIKWISSEEINSKFAVNASYLPIRKESFSKTYIENYAEKENIPENVKNAILMSIDQINERPTFSGLIVDKYEDIRSLIRDEVDTKAKDDVKALQLELDAGKDYDEALNEYISEDSFNKWYKDFLFKADIIINGN